MSEGVSCIIIWEKNVEYKKGTDSREPLTKCRDLRCDHVIRKEAIEKLLYAFNYPWYYFRDHTRGVDDREKSISNYPERDEGPNSSDVKPSYRKFSFL